MLLYLDHYFPVKKKKRSLSTAIRESQKGWLHMVLKNTWLSVWEMYFSVSHWTGTDGIFCRNSALLLVTKWKSEEMLLWSFKHSFLKDWNSPLDSWDLTKCEISDLLQHSMKSIARLAIVPINCQTGMYQSCLDSTIITYAELEFAADSVHRVSAGNVPTPCKFWEL